MDRYDNNPEFQEFVKQQKQQNSIPDGCVLFLIGIVGLVLFLLVLSGNDHRYTHISIFLFFNQTVFPVGRIKLL